MKKPNLLAIATATLLLATTTGQGQLTCTGTINNTSGGTIVCTPTITTPPSPVGIQPPPQAAGYRLVFSDNFNPLQLGTTWFNPGVWWETAAPSGNISGGASGLTLSWTKGQSGYDTSIATAAPSGSPAKTWTLGYIEVSMKFNPVTGAWPAIWLMPIAGITNPSGEHGEIDMFEWQSQSPTTFNGTIHDWAGNTDKQNNNGNNAHTLPAGTNLAQYHTYGLLWTNTTMSWYFDNVLMGSSPTFPIFNTQAYYLILSNQLGSNWSVGNPGNLTSQATNFQWVHVFQK